MDEQTDKQLYREMEFPTMDIQKYLVVAPKDHTIKDSGRVSWGPFRNSNGEN